MFECVIESLNRINIQYINFYKTILRIIRTVFKSYQCLIRIKKNQFENQDVRVILTCKSSIYY